MRKKREGRGLGRKAERRLEAAPWPDGFDRIFPDKDHFDSFKDWWRNIGKRQGVNLAEIPDILGTAWLHAQVERAFDEALPDFLDRSKHIWDLLDRLGHEILQVYDSDRFTRIASLAAGRAWALGAWRAGALRNWQAWPRVSARDGTTSRIPARAGEGSPAPPKYISSTAPVWRAWSELPHRLESLLDDLSIPLRRRPGHQRQPWIAPAMRYLRVAGLTKGEADSLLRLIGLKGSEAAEAARQTRPRR